MADENPKETAKRYERGSGLVPALNALPSRSQPLGSCRATTPLGVNDLYKAGPCALCPYLGPGMAVEWPLLPTTNSVARTITAFNITYIYDCSIKHCEFTRHLVPELS